MALTTEAPSRTRPPQCHNDLTNPCAQITMIACGVGKLLAPASRVQRLEQDRKNASLTELGYYWKRRHFSPVVPRYAWILEVPIREVLDSWGHRFSRLACGPAAEPPERGIKGWRLPRISGVSFSSFSPPTSDLVRLPVLDTVSLCMETGNHL